MTNSHNRASQKEGRNSERNNTSPNHNKANGSRKVTFFSDNNKSNSGGYFQQKHSNNSNNSSSSSNNSNSNSNNNNNHNNHHYHSTPSKDIVSSAAHSNQKFHNSTPKDMATNNKNHRYNNRNYQNGSPHGNGRNSPRSPISFASPAGVSRSPPNLNFAGSKYFDAPAPNSLPQPPSHWTTIQFGATPQLTLLSTVAAKATAAPPSESTSTKRRLFTNCNAMQTTKPCSLSAAAEAAGKNLCSDIFSHNLKLILNVQA